MTLKLSYININQEKINIYSKTIISDNQTVPSNTDGDSLHIIGNVNIDGYLDADKLNYTNFIIKPVYKKITTGYIKSTGLTHLGHYTNTPTIQTKTLDTSALYFNSTNENSNFGSVYFNKDTKSFHSKTNIDSKFATSFSSNNFTYSNNIVYVSSINTNKLISSRVKTTYLNTKKVDTTYLKLPYSHALLNNYIYSDMMGTLQFNKQTNNTYQLHNGTNWDTLLFDTFNDTTKKYKFEVQTTPKINSSQINKVIPFNFYYNLNIGTVTPISGNRYTLTQINYPRNDRYLLDTNNQLNIGNNKFILENPVDNGMNYSAKLTNITTLNILYMKIIGIGTAPSENIHTSNYNPGNDLSTYIDYGSNGSKVFKIFSNKINYSSGDTNIRIKNKRKISSTEYLAEIVYEP